MITKEQLQEFLPVNTKIFVSIVKVQKSGNRLVDAYAFYLDKNGEICSRWLNGFFRELALAPLTSDEKIKLVGSGYNAAQEVAERLGVALYENSSAFRYTTF